MKSITDPILVLILLTLIYEIGSLKVLFYNWKQE